MGTKYYKSPLTLLDELGIIEPAEIEIEVIAQYCGATILYESLSGCEARIIGKDNRAIITVNKNSRWERQRFSAGHELGHWMRDRNKISYSCEELKFYKEWSQDNPEFRANRYASELLLPETMFSIRAKRREMTFATVRDLASIFNTSLTATAFRLVELGSFPAVLVCSELGRRCWFFKGSDVSKKLWLKDYPTKHTITYDLLRGSNNIESPCDVYADSWFTHPSAHRYGIREDSIKISSNLVLTLLWWKDESQLLDLEDDYN